MLAGRVFFKEKLTRPNVIGAAVIIVSHDLQGDAPLADRVLRLHKGRLAEEGPTPGTPAAADVPAPMEAGC